VTTSKHVAISRLAALVVVAAIVVAAVAAPAVLPTYLLSLLSLALIAALLAASVNLLAGLLGAVSIGQAGISAAASYAIAWATLHGHGLGAQLALAAVVILLVSAVYGLTTMRTSGIVFLMITLALGMVVYGLALKLSSITGGQNGLTAIRRPAELAGAAQFYLLTAAVTGLVFTGLWVIGRSPFGLTLRGVRSSESRMRSLGYPVPGARFLAVLLSGMVAGVAGILAVWNSEFISPASASFSRSAFAVVMMILGGAGTLAGPLVGAFVVVGVEQWLSSFVERWPTVLGLALIAVVLFAPEGVVGGLSAWLRRAGSRGRRLAPVPVPVSPMAARADPHPDASGSPSLEHTQKEDR
jgi:branched-chain amino acid transport system permease protein